MNGLSSEFQTILQRALRDFPVIKNDLVCSVNVQLQLNLMHVLLNLVELSVASQFRHLTVDLFLSKMRIYKFNQKKYVKNECSLADLLK